MQDGIFVSYSHKDNDTVQQLVATLREVTEKEIWFDHKLRGGENYFSVIANQIVSNRFFIFVVSDSSIESDWCLRELEFASSEKRRIIAILLGDVTIPPRVKLIIQNTHYINWYSSDPARFSQDLLLALDPSSVPRQGPALARDGDDPISAQHRYYLDKDDLVVISGLLRGEEKEKYETCFLPENANLLGMAYEMGVCVEADHKKAALYYKASKYQGNPDGIYLHAALMQQQDPDNPEHKAQMLHAAELGSALARVNVGDCYYEGMPGFPVDKKKAYEYYEQAARANNTTAMYYVAYGYNQGECLPKDPELACMYVLRAKEKGFPRAYRLLGFMYQDGEYLEKDLQKALELFGEAIKRGDGLSLCYQGYVYGLLGQPEKKAELYIKAAELAEQDKIKSGMPFYRMGVLYKDGEAVEKDIQTAARYYLKAAGRKYRTALKWAVNCITKVPEDKQLPLLLEAYNLNCENAAYLLGRKEAQKEGGPQDPLPAGAVSYFEAGAVQGDMRCVLELIRNHSTILGRGRNDTDRLLAIKWFRFFFATADEKFINQCRERNLLATYYYAYALELDYAPDIAKPDREFVLYNLRKSLEECPVHLGKILHFAVKRYLTSPAAGGGWDIPHGGELLRFALDFLPAYAAYIRQNSPEASASDLKTVGTVLGKGLRFVSECYRTGSHVGADMEKAELYRELAIRLELQLAEGMK